MRNTYCGGAPSEPAEKTSEAAADSAVLYASVDALFDCRSCVSASVTSVMDPAPLRNAVSAESKVVCAADASDVAAR